MIDVAIVDENGAVERRLTDEATLRAFNRVLAEHGSNPTFSCLRFVDPHGDTTFNQLQAEALKHELALVAERTEDAESRRAVEAVEALVDEVKRGVHLYLKFVGD